MDTKKQISCVEWLICSFNTKVYNMKELQDVNMDRKQTLQQHEGPVFAGCGYVSWRQSLTDKMLLRDRRSTF